MGKCPVYINVLATWWCCLSLSLSLFLSTQLISTKIIIIILGIQLQLQIEQNFKTVVDNDSFTLRYKKIIPIPNTRILLLIQFVLTRFVMMMMFLIRFIWLWWFQGIFQCYHHSYSHSIWGIFQFYSSTIFHTLDKSLFSWVFTKDRLNSTLNFVFAEILWALTSF